LLGTGPFWVVNADIWIDYLFSRRALPENSLAHLVLVPNPAHNPGGDFSMRGDRLSPGGAHAWTYSGVSMLHPELFRRARPGRFPLAPLLNAAARLGRLSGEIFTGAWMDVGTIERMDTLKARLGSKQT
jgi:MurNAc alpha-1-phosphate uridylyltransferase